MSWSAYLFDEVRRAVKLSFVVLAVFWAISSLTAAPRMQYQGNPYYQDDNRIAIKEMRDSIEDIRHEVNNHEAEIRMFDEKLTNFDSIIENVRDQLSNANRSHKEQLKGSSANLESKIAALETTSNGLMTDLKLFKTHSNETSAVLMQYKQKIAELEKIIDQQNQNIEYLQAAMRSLMEVLQGKAAVSIKPSVKSTGEGMVSSTSVLATAVNSDRCYKIKAGDSLEKIARSYQVSIQSLKDLNGLTSDLIVVGKTLIIPEK